MKKLSTMVLTIILVILPFCSYATEAEMKETLVQIIEQLESIKPLVNKAEKEQPKDARVKVQFDSYKDAEGLAHNGLKQDINSIQKSLEDIVNQQGLEERHIAPIKSDFVG